MAEETVIEYETVEKEETRTLCDNCGRSDKKSEMVTIAINPQKKVRKGRDLQLVETFDDQLDAQQFISDKQTPPPRHNFGNREWGVGVAYHEEVVDMFSSGTADVCSTCLTNLFDIDIDVEEIKKLNIKKGELNIEIEKEYNPIIKQGVTKFLREDWARWQVNSWPTRVILYPLYIVGIMMDLFNGTSTGEEHYYRMKGFIVSFLGSTLWFTISLIVLFILS